MIYTLFNLYISKVFEKMLIFYLEILALFFIDDLGFIAYGYLIKKLAKIFWQVITVILN